MASQVARGIEKGMKDAYALLPRRVDEFGLLLAAAASNASNGSADGADDAKRMQACDPSTGYGVQGHKQAY